MKKNLEKTLKEQEEKYKAIIEDLKKQIEQLTEGAPITPEKPAQRKRSLSRRTNSMRQIPQSTTVRTKDKDSLSPLQTQGIFNNLRC